eukprot:GHVU01235266.1.p2 GENE.GHVU01235266.1~~GHVU01235266.1.p2  ORF type:complete len:129 (-),score=5.86 GHVU01235266.1:371-757(-)
MCTTDILAAGRMKWPGFSDSTPTFMIILTLAARYALPTVIRMRAYRMAMSVGAVQIFIRMARETPAIATRGAPMAKVLSGVPAEATIISIFGPRELQDQPHTAAIPTIRMAGTYHICGAVELWITRIA